MLFHALRWRHAANYEERHVRGRSRLLDRWMEMAFWFIFIRDVAFIKHLLPENRGYQDIIYRFTSATTQITRWVIDWESLGAEIIYIITSPRRMALNFIWHWRAYRASDIYWARLNLLAHLVAEKSFRVQQEHHWYWDIIWRKNVGKAAYIYFMAPLDCAHASHSRKTKTAYSTHARRFASRDIAPATMRRRRYISNYSLGYYASTPEQSISTIIGEDYRTYLIIDTQALRISARAIDIDITIQIAGALFSPLPKHSAAFPRAATAAEHWKFVM